MVIASLRWRSDAIGSEQEILDSCWFLGALRHTGGLSGRIDARVDAGSGIRQKSGSTKGVEWRTQRL